ncbi:MAG: FkbM family methyltransferase [Verrucomicrobia bacterium]|nr:FkbM family methyltransferase [Verrucomicrobiota bacterium]MBT4227508.1 FkbM family methyltransferase [Verrucomicrobiota bacterium]MBT6104538.1 FkbM family methyltransferase [Verrucomicrobiota bacterium]
MPCPLRRLNCLDPTVQFFIKSRAAVSAWPMALSTIQIQLADREHTFTYPQAEEKMILSVFEGVDYPLAKARITVDSPTIIDIGSNCGAAAVYFKSHHPGARVICYEPCAATHELLLTNVGPIDGIETNPFGIWDREGTFRLHYGPERRTGSFTLSQWGKDFGGEDIVTKKLSDELKRLKLPSVCSRWTPKPPSRRFSTSCSPARRTCPSATSSSSITASPSANISSRNFAQSMTSIFVASVPTGRARCCSCSKNKISCLKK